MTWLHRSVDSWPPSDTETDRENWRILPKNLSNENIFDKQPPKQTRWQLLIYIMSCRWLHCIKRPSVYAAVSMKQIWLQVESQSQLKQTYEVVFLTFMWLKWKWVGCSHHALLFDSWQVTLTVFDFSQWYYKQRHQSVQEALLLLHISHTGGNCPTHALTVKLSPAH